ncbi:MAG: FtsQ-type POTRA domain-containing protein [Bacteroidetes bacterium]|nr:MAG: FtsQ-type POTRA domain-containing protein [Bacteroidota bacterium]
MNPELLKSLKRIGWVSGLFFALIMVVSAVERKQGSRVKSVEVVIEKLPEGYLLINEDDVRGLIHRSFGYDLEGQSLANINVNRIERILEEDPFVRNAEVTIDFLNKIEINVEQREPILRIKDNNGLNYYLDKDGNKLPLSKHFTARVIVGTGSIAPHSPDFLERKQHTLKDVFLLTKLIIADEFWKSMIEQINMSNGEMTLIPKVGDQKIRFGRFENAEEKLWRLRKFYEEGIAYEGWQKYKAIDLRFKDQVVCER